MTLEPGTWQSNTDLGLFPFSELHCMSLVNNLSFVAFLRKFKRMYKESESRSVMSDSLPPQGLYSPWNSPGQNTGAGSLSLLQGIFPTQGLNPGLLHCRWIIYQLSHEGSPSILEWVTYPFSSGSSLPRNRTRVSCIADSLPTELSEKSKRMYRKKKNLCFYYSKSPLLLLYNSSALVITSLYIFVIVIFFH